MNRRLCGGLTVWMVLAWLLPAAWGQPIRQLDPDRDPVRFRAQELPNATKMDPDAIARRAVVRQFLDSHPNYTIDAFTMPETGAAAAGMDSGPLMAIAAGVPPHCIYVNFRQSSTYISKGFLEPLEILLARVQSDDPRVRQVDEQGRWVADPTPQQAAEALEQIRQRVPQVIWPVVYRENEARGLNSPKHAWSVPLGVLVKTLNYRRDVFFEAGLDPDDPPTDWDELLYYSRRITDPDKKRYGMAAAGGQNLSWGVYSFLVSTDARAVRRDPQTGQWRAAFGTRGCADAIYMIWRLTAQPFIKLPGGMVLELDPRTVERLRDADSIVGLAVEPLGAMTMDARGDVKVLDVASLGAVTLPYGSQLIATGAMKMSSPSEWGLLFPRGQVGMLTDYMDEEMLADINPQLVGIAPIPRSPYDQVGAEVNARMLGVFANSTPLQKLAVMKFIWYYTSDEARAIRTRSYVESGFGQFVSPRLLERYGYERLLRRVPKGWQQAYDTALEYGVPEPYGKNTQNIYRFMSQPISEGLEAMDKQDWASLPREQAVDNLLELCEASARRVDKDVLGNIPDDVMIKRRRVAAVVLVLLGTGFAFMMVSIWRYFSAVAAPANENRGFSKFGWGYALMAPGILLVLWWQYIPLVAGLSISFMDFQLVEDSSWVGLDNFAMVIYDARFWAGLARTFYFVTLVICLQFWPPILLAILLQEVPTNTAKYVYRTIYYLPQVMAGVVVYFLWSQLYDPAPSGVLNQLVMMPNRLGPVSATLLKLVFWGMWGSVIWVLLALPVKLEEISRPLKVALWAVGLFLVFMTLRPVVESVGSGGISQASGFVLGEFHIEALGWTQDRSLAMLCLVVPLVWATAGPQCILYLAALKTVPDELYEAAEIDGAGNWHKVFYIVLPRLKYLIMIQFIASVIFAFKGGTEFVLVLTGGGPNDATMLLSLEIFINTFMDLRYGIGAAMSWLLGGLLIGFTAYQLRLLSRAEFRAGG
jgi:multiple sugar transport system permease protein